MRFVCVKQADGSPGRFDCLVVGLAQQNLHFGEGLFLAKLRGFGGEIPGCREAFESQGVHRSGLRNIALSLARTKVPTVPRGSRGQVRKLVVKMRKTSPVQPTRGIIVREGGGGRACRQGQRSNGRQSIGSAHDLRPIRNLQLLHDPADMNFHGAFA